jgi:hypothetical protein
MKSRWIGTKPYKLGDGNRGDDDPGVCHGRAANLAARPAWLYTFADASARFITLSANDGLPYCGQTLPSPKSWMVALVHSNPFAKFYVAHEAAGLSQACTGRNRSVTQGGTSEISS